VDWRLREIRWRHGDVDGWMAMPCNLRGYSRCHATGFDHRQTAPGHQRAGPSPIAALVVDGRLVRVVETERVTREKYANHRSPAPAIHACLAAEGITLSSVDAVAVGWDY
jgi:hypothetical protein